MPAPRGAGDLLRNKAGLGGRFGLQGNELIAQLMGLSLQFGFDSRLAFIVVPGFQTRQ